MRIAIMGSGGLGGYFGGMLARAGEDVHFIARGPHLEAIIAIRLTTSADSHIVCGIKHAAFVKALNSVWAISD